MSLAGMLPVEGHTLIGLVLQQLVNQMGADASAAGYAGPPEEMLAQAIAGWIKPFLEATAASQGQQLAQIDDGADGDLDGLDRNCELAAALGACGCWGEFEGCRTCGGQGTPGWRQPDRTLFMFYVQPTIDRIRAERSEERRVGKECCR